MRAARLACRRTRRHTSVNKHSQLSNQSSGLPRTTVLTAKERRLSLNGLVIPARLRAGGEIRTHTRLRARSMSSQWINV